MSQNKPARRIVLKLGTNLLTSGRGRLDTGIMSDLVGQVARLRRQGFQFLIVSSGAVAAGRSKLGLTPESSRELKGIPLKQVLAAVGQSGLMKTYEELFEKHGVVVAQALLSRSDLVDRAGYLNARNTLMALIDLGVITVINENDVVAVEELEGACFGDNDNLSGMVANLIDADLLIMLTDIGGLYTADPRCNEAASLITEVTEITGDIRAAAAGPRVSGGTGGMVTKLEAAGLATNSGVTVVIVPGREPDVIARVLRGEAIGTRFIPSARRESRERWMLSGLSTRGRVTVDEGASRALLLQNRSLLAAGIKNIGGDFERGDIVDILDSTGKRLGCGISSYSSVELSRIIGKRSNNISAILGHDYGAEVVHRNNLALVRED